MEKNSNYLYSLTLNKSNKRKGFYGNEKIILPLQMRKMKEIREIFKCTGYEIVSMKEAGLKFSIEENGKTFTENALIKARCGCQGSGCDIAGR